MAQTNEKPSSGTDIQKVLQTGMEAAQLMNSQIFQMAYQETLNHYFNEWLSTQVDHSRKREEIYFRLRGLQDSAQTLAGYVAQAETIQQQQQQQQPNQYGFKAEEYQ